MPAYPTDAGVPVPTGHRFRWRCVRWLLGTALAAVLGATTANAAENRPYLAEFSLSQLMDIRVSSVSLRLQEVDTVPAAVTVLTDDDIRRSGAQSIPDLLRLVPGVHVGQITTNIWSITARGFGGRLANKLLVLIDGRTVYSQVFSGTFWDAQDLILEDIERIEVIRGPGASIWGSNAVNGVINIITKSAADTTGALVTGIVGDDQELGLAARYGARLSDSSHLRVFTKFTEYAGREGMLVAGKHGEWDMGQVGFRLDSEFRDQNAFSLHGNFYSSNINQVVTTPVLTAPYARIQEYDGGKDGFYIAGRWERNGEKSSLALRGYISRNEHDDQSSDLSETVYDIEFQNTLNFGEARHLVWGFGYRQYEESFEPRSGQVFFDPADKSSYLLNAFAQFEMGLFDEALNLIIGARLEDHEYTGFEIQPTARFVWSPSDRQTIWGAVSRAVRIPSRGDLDVALDPVVIPPMSLEGPGALPAAVRILGNDALDSEELLSFELGYRIGLANNASLEVSGFHNSYSNLFYQISLGAPFFETIPAPPHLVIPLSLQTGVEADAHGIEISANWLATDWLRLTAGYSYFDLHVGKIPQDAAGPPPATDGTTPRHMLTLIARASPFDHWETDAIMRVVGKVAAVEIESYTAIDLRMGWRPNSALDISIVGRNLFANNHFEYGTDYLGNITTKIPTSVLGKLTWRH